jgi:hypothetical protein
MGDPTLHMHIVAPPASLRVTRGSSEFQLQWQASADAADEKFLGYYVYSSDSMEGPFTVINGGAPVMGTSFTTADLQHRVFMVRAAKREEPFGESKGSYINLSQGAFPLRCLNPQVINETFSFNVEGPPYEFIAIETSSDLENWYGWDIAQLDAQGHYSQLDTGPLGAAGYFRVAGGLENEYESANTVGYVQRVVTAGGTVAIANQFLRADNSVADILPNVPNFTYLYKWIGQNWEINTFFFGEWDNPSMNLLPGEGMLLSSGEAYTATFVGSVPEGTLVVPLTSGYTFAASKVPQGGDVTGLGVALNNFDNIQIRNGSGYDTYTYAFGDWDPSTPIVLAGEPFFTNLGSPINWTRTFHIWDFPAWW